jgi:hypothetical protein
LKLHFRKFSQNTLFNCQRTGQAARHLFVQAPGWTVNNPILAYRIAWLGPVLESCLSGASPSLPGPVLENCFSRAFPSHAPDGLHRLERPPRTDHRPGGSKASNLSVRQLRLRGLPRVRQSCASYGSIGTLLSPVEPLSEPRRQIAPAPGSVVPICLLQGSGTVRVSRWSRLAPARTRSLWQ